MRCRNCDYRLWNIASRTCPECGVAFRVSDFEFVRGSVAFCCPHCDMAYYGTDEKGHLVPSSFYCAKCQQPVTMESMVLRPAQGVEEMETERSRIPWVARPEIGLRRALTRTIWMAMVHPIQLMRSSTTDEPPRAAWNFAAWSLLITLGLGAGLVFAVEMLVILLVVPVGRTGVVAVFAIGLGFVVVLALGVLLNLVCIVIWGWGVQAALWLTGTGHKPLSQTYRALLYSTGANVSSIMPCLGWYFGWIWWLVSAVIMVRETHRISSGRAAFAVLALPGILLVCGTVAYVALLSLLFSTATGPLAFATTGPGFAIYSPAYNETQLALNAYLDYATENGKLPTHPIELLLDDRMAVTDFVSSASNTNLSQAGWPGMNAKTLDGMSETAKATKISSFVAGLPKNGIAHRGGDFVFTCPGVDPSTLTPDVWLVIYSPMSDPGGSTKPFATFVYVGCADGTVIAIPNAAFQNSLQGQMAVRTRNNLPPLPILSSITQSSPAVATESGE